MSIKRIQTKKRMSRIVIHNDTIYLCGQVGDDYRSDIKEQTRTMLAKVDDLLAQSNSNKQSILSATIYIKEMRLFGEMNEVWDNWIPENFSPARACIQASMASPELLVEISIVAAVVR
jgi:enamine deaminase RidA (YjgF/YER057c/UK114 family)